MSIELITGPMFAGKSLAMLLKVHKFFLAKQKCLLVRSRQDARYTNETITDLSMCTHNKISASEIPVVFADTIEECIGQIKSDGVLVVGIDEGQFFSDIAPMCEKLATEMNVNVFVAALDGTYDRKPFETISKLAPHCDAVVKLKAVCGKCNGQDAIFSHLLNKDSTKTSSDSFIVGGMETYTSLCRRCYKTHVLDVIV
jgi:thymidine kinase